jgi:cellobiose phosphorylase
MFSHMAVMYGNALYRRGFVREGYKLFAALYRHCKDFSRSRMYPGLPEYVNSKGRGMYPYLTGSASWLLLTLLIEVFGVKGKLGDLVLEPKLVREQFDGQGQAAVTTIFAGRSLTVMYHNPDRLDFGQYALETVQINNQPLSFHSEAAASITIPRRVVTALAAGQSHQVDIWLG